MAAIVRVCIIIVISLSVGRGARHDEPCQGILPRHGGYVKQRDGHERQRANGCEPQRVVREIETRVGIRGFHGHVIGEPICWVGICYMCNLARLAT